MNEIDDALRGKLNDAIDLIDVTTYDAAVIERLKRDTPQLRPLLRIRRVAAIFIACAAIALSISTVAANHNSYAEAIGELFTRMTHQSTGPVIIPKMDEVSQASAQHYAPWLRFPNASRFHLSIRQIAATTHRRLFIVTYDRDVSIEESLWRPIPPRGDPYLYIVDNGPPIRMIRLNGRVDRLTDVPVITHATPLHAVALAKRRGIRLLVNYDPHALSDRDARAFITSI